MKLKFNLNTAIKKNNSKIYDKVIKENLNNVCSTEHHFESEQCNLKFEIENLNECSLNIKLFKSETTINQLDENNIHEIPAVIDTGIVANEKQGGNLSKHQDYKRTSGNVTEQNQSAAGCETVQLLHEKNQLSTINNAPSRVNKSHTNPIRIADEDERDPSKLTLLELINIELPLPHTQPRLKKSNKRSGNNSDRNMELEQISGSSQQKSVDKQKSKKFRIDLDGQIVIDDDEDETNMQIGIEAMEEIVENAADLRMSYRDQRKHRLSGKRWNAEETSNFYLALLYVKTDFTRMATVFKGRSRADLKKKFKVEEKANLEFVDKILEAQLDCDISNLVIDSHLNPPTKRKKPGYYFQSSRDEESDKPKRRYRKFDIKKANLDPSAGDLPDYFKPFKKLMK